MRFKLLLVLAALGIGSNVYGQVISPCKTGQNEAEQIISRGSIYFPRLTVESTITLRKILEVEYGIKDDIYDNGTCEREEDEAECFYEVMRTKIENKWGKDFLKDQRRIADELDKNEQGYVAPKVNGIADSLKNYFQMNQLTIFSKVGYLVAVKISPEKNIIDVQVSTGLPGSIGIPKYSKDYKVIFNALQEIPNNFEPAKLRGLPIESILLFWIKS